MLDDRVPALFNIHSSLFILPEHAGGLMATLTIGATELFAGQTVRKIQLRLLPFILLLYIVAVLNRVNVAFAALTMNKELGITAGQFGFLAGIFFWGYFFFEIPSNILLHKFGARRLIARILITWGIVAGSTGFVQNATHLYIIRFLLGLAEAGFFPGMSLYLTFWFRERERAQAVAFIMTAQPISAILGAPLSGLILDHIHWLNVSSWRWMLILEALPAIILGFVTLSLLPDGPEDAKFLDREQKDWLEAELARERAARQTPEHGSYMKALVSGRVWYLAIIYFAFMNGLNAMNFWLPQVVKALARQTNTQTGFLVAIPHLIGLTAMIILSRHSDRTGERRFHAAIPAVLGGLALLLLTKAPDPVVSIAFLALMAIGVDSSFGPFWSLPSQFLTGAAAASGIALINSVGNLGGFLGPYIIGALKDRYNSTGPGMAVIGGFLILAAALIVAMPRYASGGTPESNTTQEPAPELAKH
jgi:ACS family tartrate transporter-like MFS transporter